MVIRRAVFVVTLLLIAACGRGSTEGTPGEAPSPNPPKPRTVFRIEALPSPAPTVCAEGLDPEGLELCQVFDGQSEGGLGVCVKAPPPDPDSDLEPCEPRLLLTAQRGLVEVRPLSWEWAAVSPDDRTLVLAFPTTGTPCDRLDHVKVVESPNSFVITVFLGIDAEKAGKGRDESSKEEYFECILPLVYSATFVTLPSPLGNRQLLDGSGRELTPSPEPGQTK
jgi:hypothetical protein